MLLVSAKALPATGLVHARQPGRLHLSHRACTPGRSEQSTALPGRTRAQAAFPDAGWEIRDRSDAAPGIKRFVEQVTMFLTLVGLTALGVGGVGAGQAITAFLDRKRADIAILKSLGAVGRLCLPGLLPAGDGGGAGRHIVGRRHRRGAAVRRGLVLWRRPAGAAELRALSGARCCWRWLSACCRPSPSRCRRWPRPRRAAGQPVPRCGGACHAERPGPLSRHLGRRGAGRSRLLTWCWRPRRSSPPNSWPAPPPCWRCCACWRKACGAASPPCPAPRTPLLRLALANLTRPGRRHRRRRHGAGAGPDPAGHRHLLNGTINAQVAERPARPRAQLLLCRYPARRSGGLRQAPSPAFPAPATTSARR